MRSFSEEDDDDSSDDLDYDGLNAELEGEDSDGMSMLKIKYFETKCLDNVHSLEIDPILKILIFQL